MRPRGTSILLHGPDRFFVRGTNFYGGLIFSGHHKQLREEIDPPVPESNQPKSRRGKCPMRFSWQLVSSKLEEGDFSGAVKLTSSDTSLAPMNELRTRPYWRGIHLHPLTPPLLWRLGSIVLLLLRRRRFY